jgi:cytochrome c
MNGTTTRVVLLVCAALLAACGQVATPIWEAVTEEAHSEEVAVLPTSIDLEPTVAATEVPPTATEVPPTATDVPPTATPEPTEVPPTATVEPTEEAAAVGDAEAGQALFVAGGDLSLGALACSTCHNVDNPNTLIGPSLQGVAERAGTRVAGEDAVTYLHQSIVDPNAYVVEGFAPGLMPQVYGDAFTEDQINDLVAYLLTLE